MKRINNFHRANKLIDKSIEQLKLDLTDMTVLTEAASGNFIVTPVIALKAGAKKVYVVTRDSSYGKKTEVMEYLKDFVDAIGENFSKIICVNDKNSVAQQVNIVTNSGFVRPIDAGFINGLPQDAAIPLMFESWEYREEDIDIQACKNNNIPVLGTDESVFELRIFKYVAMSVVKLLLEADIEVFKSNILLISSGGYLQETKQLLQDNGANVLVYDSFQPNIDKQVLKEYISFCDAIVVAEQANEETLIGMDGKHINVEWLADSRPIVIHVAGVIDYEQLDKNSIYKYPDKKVGYGYMTVTTDYVGIRPVIELNAGGLKVGQALVEGMREFQDVDTAKQYALSNSPAMRFDY